MHCEKKLHKQSLTRLLTQAHWSHSQTHTIMDFKLVEAEALLQIHHCFFSHSIKQRVIPLLAVTVSLHASPAIDV